MKNQIIAASDDRMDMINYQAIDLIEIRQQATNLLIKCGLLGQFPLPLDKIASHLGYEVKVFEPTADITKISGTVSKLRKSILLNGRETYTRQRFTLAHEIGHICLHFNNESEFVDYNRDDHRTLQEDQADEFAACLLMPEESFISEWKQTEGNFNKLANFFGVSQAAIGMRAHRLGLQ